MAMAAAEVDLGNPPRNQVQRATQKLAGRVQMYSTEDETNWEVL
jgi:hypothetical protein